MQPLRTHCYAELPDEYHNCSVAVELPLMWNTVLCLATVKYTSSDFRPSQDKKYLFMYLE